MNLTEIDWLLPSGDSLSAAYLSNLAAIHPNKETGGN